MGSQKVKFNPKTESLSIGKYLGAYAQLIDVLGRKAGGPQNDPTAFDRNNDSR
jgi:hypothetical protein